MSIKCASCESLNKESVLSVEAVAIRLQSMPLWTLNEKGQLSRSFSARNFVAAMNFLTAAGNIAEQTGHHPDFHLTSYRNVEVILYTHSVNGITENDFQVASLLDTLPVDYSPKWLEAHISANSSSINCGQNITGVISGAGPCCLTIACSTFILVVDAIERGTGLRASCPVAIIAQHSPVVVLVIIFFTPMITVILNPLLDNDPIDANYSTYVDFLLGLTAPDSSS
eukprot:gene6750-13678_t